MQLVAEGILELLTRLQRVRNLTYMFFTHDISTERAIADDVVVIKNEEVVAGGSKEQVLSPPFRSKYGLVIYGAGRLISRLFSRSADSCHPRPLLLYVGWCGWLPVLVSGVDVALM